MLFVLDKSNTDSATMIFELVLTVVLIMVTMILWLLYQEHKVFSRLPCRWKSSPIIGNTYLSKIDQNQLGCILFDDSQKLRQPLLSYRQFGMYFVAINDYANYKELLVDHGAHTRVVHAHSKSCNDQFFDASTVFLSMQVFLTHYGTLVQK